MIMLLIIAGISFTWYFLHEEREKNEKKYEGRDEFDVLLETTEVPEEDKDTYLNETSIMPEENLTTVKDKKVKKIRKTKRK